MTDDELRKLAEAALEQDKAATPGPLSARYEPHQPYGGGDAWHIDAGEWCIACDLREGDARQFAAARTREPELARAVLRLLEERDAAIDRADGEGSIRGHERQRYLCAIPAAGAGGGYETCQIRRERDDLARLWEGHVCYANPEDE